MRCPNCESRDSRVVDSRDLDDAATIRRRRECSTCGTRFTTYERMEAARLVIVKRDGARQEFDRDKLAAGLRKALTRRPVHTSLWDHLGDVVHVRLAHESDLAIVAPATCKSARNLIDDTMVGPIARPSTPSVRFNA